MFCIIPEKVLVNQGLTSDCKILIGILNSMRKANAYYWGSFNYLSNICGMSETQIASSLSLLKDLGVIREDSRGLILSDDPEEISINVGTPKDRLFKPKSLSEKCHNMMANGWTCLAENDHYIQLTHPDNSEIVMLAKNPDEVQNG